MTNQEEAIMRLRRFKETSDGTYEWSTFINKDDLKAFDMAIKALEQEPCVGYWIINKDKSLARCSNCKFLLKDKDEIELFGTFMQGYNHCPYCGAKMIEPQESEE